MTTNTMSTACLGITDSTSSGSVQLTGPSPEMIE